MPIALKNFQQGLRMQLNKPPRRLNKLRWVVEEMLLNGIGGESVFTFRMKLYRNVQLAQNYWRLYFNSDRWEH